MLGGTFAAFGAGLIREQTGSYLLAFVIDGGSAFSPPSLRWASPAQHWRTPEKEPRGGLAQNQPPPYRAPTWLHPVGSRAAENDRISVGE